MKRTIRQQKKALKAVEQLNKNNQAIILSTNDIITKFKRLEQ